MNKNFFVRIFSLILPLVLLLTAVFPASALAVSAPGDPGDPGNLYDIVFDAGTLKVKINPDAVYDILKDGKLSREELLRFIPADVLEAIRERDLSPDTLARLASKYITIDDIKELVSLVPVEVLKNYFNPEMLFDLVSLDELISLIPLDEIFAAIDPAKISSLINEEALALLLKDSVIDKVLEGGFVDELLNDDEFINDILSDPAVKNALTELIDDEMIDAILADPVTGGGIKSYITGNEVLKNLVAQSAVLDYFLSPENREKLMELLGDGSVAAEIIKLDSLKNTLFDTSIIESIIDKNLLPVDRLTSIFTDAQIKSFVNDGTFNALLGDAAFLNGVFADATLINKILTDDLVVSLAKTGEFSAYVTPEILYNDGLITADELYDAFGITDPEEAETLTLEDVLDANLVTVAELRTYITNDIIKDKISESGAVKALISDAVLEKTDFSDYADYIDSRSSLQISTLLRLLPSLRRMSPFFHNLLTKSRLPN